MATQVSQAKTEILSPVSKPINPFSIENLLKSEPPSPPSSDPDEVTDNSDSNPSSNPPSEGLVINPQLAWQLYQFQLQNYWRYLLINNLAQQQGKSANIKCGTPVKPLLIPRVYVAPNKPKGDNVDKNLFKIQSPARGTKRHDVITPSTEKKMKLDLYMKESTHAQQDRPLITPAEYEMKCSKAMPILHDNEANSNQASLSHNTFLEMVDINKVLDHSVTDLNVIIDNSTFSDEERAYIRELRRKAMNKKAAEECRRRKKSEEQHLNEEFDLLRGTRRRLFSEKERILLDINSLKKTVGELPPESLDAVSPTHEPSNTTLNPLN